MGVSLGPIPCSGHPERVLDGSAARSRLKPLRGLWGAPLYARRPCPGRIELGAKTGTKWDTVRGRNETNETLHRGVYETVSHLRYLAYISVNMTVLEDIQGVSFFL